MGRFSKLDLENQALTPVPKADDWPDLDDSACLRDGDENFYEGHYEPALNAYSRALRFNRDLPAAWLGQIRCLIEMGEFPEAVTWSDRALEKFPNHPDLLASKGLALMKMGDTVAGTEYSDGAVELRATSAWVWLARGECLLLAGQPEANVNRCFLKALEYSEGSNTWQSELAIGTAYNGVRKWASARRHLVAAQRLNTDHPVVLYQLALAQEGLGETRAAAGLLQRACEIRRYPEARDALLRVRGANPVSQLWKRLTSKN